VVGLGGGESQITGGEIGIEGNRAFSIHACLKPSVVSIKPGKVTISESPPNSQKSTMAFGGS
jgi:hypothetical protein